MIIVIQCTDQVGLVASITKVMAKEQLNIVSMREHVDQAQNRFFMRLEITYGGEGERPVGAAHAQVAVLAGVQRLRLRVEQHLAG